MDSTGPKKSRERKTSTTKHPPMLELSGEALSAYLVSLTAHADLALTAAQACKHAKRDGHEVDAAEVEHTFASLANAGRLFRHPPAGRDASSAQRYWRESADAFVHRCLQRSLAANAQITLAKLYAAAPPEYGALLDTAIATLLHTGKLFEKPGTKTRTFTTTQLPATSILTAAQLKGLDSMLRKLNALRSHPLTLNELLHFLDGLDGLDGNEPAASGAAPAPAPTLALLDELYRLDLPSRGGLTSMPIPFTWRRYAQCPGSADRAAFEQLLLDSAAAGRIELIAHEWPATLSAADLAAAIRQPNGRVLYYWRPLEQ